MLFIFEASLQNPQNVAHFYLYFIGDSHRYYIGHYFRMKSSYIIDYLSSNRMLNLVDYYSLLRLIKLETQITTISFCGRFWTVL